MGRALVRALEGDAQPGILRRDPRDLRREPDRLVAGADALLQRPDEVAVAAGDEPVHQLHHAHPRAQRRVDGGHLQPDDAAADDEEALRHVVEHECIGRVHQPRIVFGNPGTSTAREPAATIARSNPTSVVPSGVVTLRRWGDTNAPFALHNLNLALLREPGESAGEPRNDPVLPARELREIDRRRAELDAVRGHLRRAVDDRAGVEQGPSTECTRR